ncbi:MAG: TetR/AcrR family transcriptional regulator [Sporichthyaceae bacterium]
MKTQRVARGTVTVDAIEETALRIADTEGLEALNMRRLAGDLGVGVMTLYGHVRTKDELIERITERAIAELMIPQNGTWSEQLEQLFTNLRALLLAHPAVLYADAARPVSGPGALHSADAALGMLLDGGLDGEQSVAGLSTLIAYTFGSAMFRLHQTADGTEDYARHVRGADPAQLPNVAAVTAHLLSRGSEAEFGIGLRLIIDGLARQAEGTS